MLNSRFYTIKEPQNTIINYHYVSTILPNYSSGYTYFKTKWLKKLPYLCYLIGL